MTSNPREIERKFLVTGDGWKRRATGHTAVPSSIGAHNIVVAW